MPLLYSGQIFSLVLQLESVQTMQYYNTEIEQLTLNGKYVRFLKRQKRETENSSFSLQSGSVLSLASTLVRTAQQLMV